MDASLPSPDAELGQRSAGVGWSLCRSLIAALAAWCAIQAVHPVFVVPEEYHVQSLGAPVEKFDAWRRELNKANGKNAVVYGSAIGLLLSLSPSFRRFDSQSLIRSLAAGPLGGLAGAGAGLAASVVHVGGERATLDGQLVQSIAVQAVWWSLIGLGVGAAYGCQFRSLPSILTSAFAGVLAGGLAAIVYLVGMSVLLADVDTRPLVPLEPTSRLIWVALAAALIGAIVQTASRPAARPT